MKLKRLAAAVTAAALAVSAMAVTASADETVSNVNASATVTASFGVMLEDGDVVTVSANGFTAGDSLKLLGSYFTEDGMSFKSIPEISAEGGSLTLNVSRNYPDESGLPISPNAYLSVNVKYSNLSSSTYKGLASVSDSITSGALGINLDIVGDETEYKVTVSDGAGITAEIGSYNGEAALFTYTEADGWDKDPVSAGLVVSGTPEDGDTITVTKTVSENVTKWTYKNNGSASSFTPGDTPFNKGDTVTVMTSLNGLTFNDGSIIEVSANGVSDGDSITVSGSYYDQDGSLKSMPPIIIDEGSRDLNVSENYPAEGDLPASISTNLSVAVKYSSLSTDDYKDLKSINDGISNGDLGINIVTKTVTGGSSLDLKGMGFIYEVAPGETGDTVVDDKTGVILETVDGTEIDPDVVLEVQTVKKEDVEKDIEEGALAGEKLIAAYDISMTKDNTEYQPDGRVKVTVPRPAGVVNGKKAKIYHIADGKTTDMNAIYNPETNTLSFITDHFSVYVVTDDETSGDINNDDAFDIDDVIDLARSLLSSEEINPYLPDGDLDDNGTIDIDDVILLARALLTQ